MVSEFPADDPGAPILLDSLPSTIPAWLRDGQARLLTSTLPALAAAESAATNGSIGRVGAVRLRLRNAEEGLLWLAKLLGTPLSSDFRSVEANGRTYSLATVRFDGGAVAHIELDPHSPGLAFEACGSDGMISYDVASAGGLRLDSASIEAASESREIELDVRTLKAAVALQQLLNP